MPHFFLVLLKINIVLILFSATYYLVLRRLTFYSLNRLFLVFGIAFSSAYPFINLTDFFSDQRSVPAFIPQFNQNVKQFVQQDSVSIFWQALTILFYVGVLLMAIRLFVQLTSLHRMHQKSKPGKLRNFTVRILSEEVSPFSFWQTIYINPSLHKDQDLNNILEHEKVHVEEWHTLDIILAEISVIFYWFNPGVWLMKKAVRENIEFITDSKILKKGIDKKAYQYSLLDVGSLQPSIAIVNNFNLSDLKKRIKMMNTKRSSKANLSRYLLALPILLVATLAFTIDKKSVQQTIVPLANMLTISLPESNLEIAVNKPAKASKKAKIKPVQKIKNETDSVKKMTFVFKTHFETTDTTNLSISKELNKLIGKVVNINDGAKRTNSTRTYTFIDSLKIDPATLRIISSDDDLKDADKSSKGTNDKVVLIRATAKASKNQAGTQVKEGSTSGVNYFVNGNKGAYDDFKNLDVNKITDIKIIKGSSGIIHITTKP